MATNRRINLAALEFDDIKQNLKTFLQGQAQFSDYDFEGSNMSVLLDILAVNTHYNAMYMNMALNEVYLDSASKRDSVVSLAKTLGYLPRSATCAKTSVNFTLTGVTTIEPFVSMPKHTPFNGQVDGVRYLFHTIEDVTVAKNADNTYTFTDIALREGSPLTNRLPYTAQNVYIIPNSNVDLSTVVVKIQDTSVSTSFEVYQSSDKFDTLAPDSLVYFVKELDGGFYQLSFGDGVLGKPLVPGNVVSIEYFVSSGSAANNIKALSYAGRYLNGGTVINVTLNEQTNSGRFAETIDEIRFNAPNMYAAQNRAVTAADYEALILSKVPSINSVSVWGGENNYPPVYGKVFISAATSTGNQLTYNEQQTIINDVLNKFKVLTVIPEFVAPNYIDVVLDAVVYYDSTLTGKTPAELDTTVTQLLLDYNNTELKKFNKIFRSSAIARLIESADRSIISSVVRIKLKRGLEPVYYKTMSYTVNVGNPIESSLDVPSVTSDAFYVSDTDSPVYVDDNGSGVLRLFTLANGVRTDLKNVGTVDYEKGILYLNSLYVTSATNNQITFSLVPASPDVASIYNQIVRIDTGSLAVSVIVDESTKGRATLGNKFVFSQTRI